MKTYKCVVCGKPFEARFKTLCCPSCKVGTCIICGKEFTRKHPYTQQTCGDIQCRSEYIKRSGIGKARAQATMKTKLARYGTLDGSVIAKEKIPKKICPLCGKEFQPDTFRQVYCKEPHYVPCPVCGKLTLLRDVSIGPQACSEECRIAAINKTCLERYGNKDAVNSEHARKLAKQTSLSRWGVDHPMKSTEVQDHVRATMIERYGVPHAMQDPDIQKQAEQTCIERYGVPHPAMNAEIKQKAKETAERNYGGFGYASDELRKRIIATNNKKYGVDYVVQRPGFYEEAQAAIEARYGAKNYNQSDAGRAALMKDASKLSEWKAFIKDCKTYISEHYSCPPPIYTLCNDLGVTDTTIYNVLIAQGGQHLINHTKQSSMEYEIIQFLSNYIPKDRIVYNSRRVIPPEEVDIFLPDYNLAIECNPTITHNSSFSDPWGSDPKLPSYHKKKTDKCLAKGVTLLHVFGYEWTARRHVIESMLLNRIGKTSSTTYARKTKVVELSASDAREFMELNHRQGFTSSHIHLGLKNEDDNILAVMSFSKVRPTLGKTQENADGYELTRFANACNTHVVGGASKLFKHFVKTYQPKLVISYSDRAHTTGKMYENLGFTAVSSSDPGYVWVNMRDDSYYNRVSCQKANLPKLFNEPDLDIVNQTERQIMESHGYAQVFDSGVIRWEWRNC